MRKLALFAFAVLSACMLHAKVPYFQDRDSVRIFGLHGVNLAVLETNAALSGASDHPPITLTPVGNHYDSPAPKDAGQVASFYFVPLDKKRFVVQIVTNGQADYAIGTWAGTQLLVSPLTCVNLKTSLKTNDLVGFLNDSCVLLPSSKPVLALFERLALRAGEPALRFERR